MVQILKNLILVLLLSLPQTAVPMLLPAGYKPQQRQPQLKVSPKLLKQIQKNKPKIDPKLARKIASVVEVVAKRHGIKAEKIIAIAMQESSYTLNAKSCFYIKGQLRCDMCMMQINDKTAKAFGFDQERLMTDLEYCIEAGALVLKDFKRMYSGKDQEWWTRYNASNPEKRTIYRNLVAQYF